jgi:N6-adenosine-specific RNA methylase IME4
MSERLAKTWADVLAAMHGHHKGLVDEGHVDPERLRLTVAARKEAVVRLRVKGLSVRQIAAAVGVPKSTVHDDLSETGQKVSETGQAIEVSEKDILAAANEIRTRKWDEKKVAAVARTSKVEFNAKALGKFAVIYADPPWRYETPIGDGSRSIENHYPTMTLDEICALPVAEIAHDDAVLFLWATAPQLAQCTRVIDAWGFNYRTGMVWAKDKIGTGYWARNQHEHLLICKRGEMPHPPESARPASLVQAPRLEHSAKPPVFYEIIEAMYPGLRKIVCQSAMRSSSASSACTCRQRGRRW